MYWRQVQPLDDGRLLHQSSESATILNAVKELREHANANHRRRCPSPTAAEKRVPEKYEQTRRDVREVLIDQPLPKLQHLGSHSDAQDFLYNEKAIDRRTTVVPLKPGVASGLAQLSRLLKPVIEYLWVDIVRRTNNILYRGAEHQGAPVRASTPTSWSGWRSAEEGVRRGVLLLQDSASSAVTSTMCCPGRSPQSMGSRISLWRATSAIPASRTTLRRWNMWIERCGATDRRWSGSPRLWNLRWRTTVSSARRGTCFTGRVRRGQRCGVPGSARSSSRWTCQRRPSGWLCPGLLTWSNLAHIRGMARSLGGD